MSKIQATFERLQSQGRRALITFLMPGDPGPELTVSLMHALAEGGSDIIELALPFSGLIADVPSIQRASDRALARVWKAQHFSYWMTTMLHRLDGASDFDDARQLGELRSIVESEAGSRYLAEAYTGWPSR